MKAPFHLQASCTQ